MSENEKKKPRPDKPSEEPAWKPDSSQLRTIYLSEDEKRRKAAKNEK